MRSSDGYDWTKPFPRDAITVIHPVTHELLLGRPSSEYGKPMRPDQYKEIEYYRKEWLKAYLDEVEQEEKALKLEERQVRQRLFVRDNLELTAEEVYKTLDGWVKWKDIDRWNQLRRWLEAHPQRDRPEDIPFEGLEERIAHFERRLQYVRPDPQKRGRPKGTPMTEEQKAAKAESMREVWRRRKQEGKIPPVGRPKKLPEPEKPEAPY